MKQYEMYEIKLAGKEPDNSFVEIEMKAEFEKDGKITCVMGFYAGDGIYAVRFYPEEAGTYHYNIKGAVAASGELECKPAEENRHGIVRAEGTHFQNADGTWFYPFGTTVYALVHQEEALVNQTMETLRQAPFNKIRICIFPKDADYNHNDPSYYAFEKKNEEWDVHHPCFRFWDDLESRIRQLNEMGIQCDLILLHPYDRWQFSKLTREQVFVYLDYVTRRLSAFPNIWWSLANEYDLLNYEKEDWECFADFLHQNDPYGHLLSNHNMIQHWDFSNKDTTHICLQIKNIDNISRKITEFQKPLMVDECRYEGNVPMEWGNISGFEMADRFWKICMQGGYCTHGETFLNDVEVLWWSKGGSLIGESPARIGFLRSILEELPGPLSFGGKDMTEATVEEQKKYMPEEMKKSPFYKTMLSASWEELNDLLSANREFIAICGEDAYIKYFSRKQTCIGILDLPENGAYEVEVIDMWEMTRKKVLTNVNGHLEIKLPGKEGIAILARR